MKFSSDPSVDGVGAINKLYTTLLPQSCIPESTIAYCTWWLRFYKLFKCMLKLGIERVHSRYRCPKIPRRRSSTHTLRLNHLPSTLNRWLNVTKDIWWLFAVATAGLLEKKRRTNWVEHKLWSIFGTRNIQHEHHTHTTRSMPRVRKRIKHQMANQHIRRTRTHKQ